MNKYKYPVYTLILFLFLIPETLLSAENSQAIITGKVLNVRNLPDTTADIMTSVTKGNVVTVLSYDKNMVTIDGINDYWHYIEYNNIKGWVFGGYISDCYYINPEANIYAWISKLNKFVLFNPKRNSEVSFEISPEACDFKISDDTRYVAIDNGTDILGYIEIYDIKSKKSVFSDVYTRHDLNWSGNAISLEITTSGFRCSGPGEIGWQEMIFRNGKIIKGAKSGTSPCHD